MRKFKTDNLEIVISVSLLDGKRLFRIGMTDDNDPLDEPQIAFDLPANITKQNFNDANFVKHLLNFFIKE